MRLIDSDKLIGKLGGKTISETFTVLQFIGMINSTPPVDAAPVIRCKDCIYTKDGDRTMGRCFCTKHGWVPYGWYCADGIRRTD